MTTGDELLPVADKAPAADYFLSDLERLLREYHDHHHTMSDATKQLTKHGIYERYINCVNAGREAEAHELIIAWRVKG